MSSIDLGDSTRRLGTGELTQLDAGELATVIRRRQVSVREVISAHLEAIADRSDLNAVARLRGEGALADADRADADVAAGRPLGRLHGVPFTVKDSIATQDLDNRCGSLATPPGLGEIDATAVARMRAAGAILTATTACPEFAFGVDCISPVTGVTASPWGAGLTPGGSSGGEAAAIAAGLSPLGLGADYGGSVRWPAACVGIVALRPTLGRVPGTGQLPGLAVSPTGRHRVPNPSSVQGTFQVIGPLARSVDDLELALRVIEGPDGLDGFTYAPGAWPSRSAPDEAPVTDLRIGWLEREDSTPVGPGARASVARAVGVLESAGALTREWATLLDGAHEAYNALRAADPLRELRELVAGREHLLGNELRQTLAAPEPDPRALAAGWAGVVEVRQRIWRAFGVGASAAKDGLDVLVCPVAPVSAFHRDVAIVVEGRTLSGFELMGLCRAISLTGLPSLVVPVGLGSDGLPMAVQLVGAPWSEPRLLEVGRHLERSLGRLSPPSR